MGDQFTIFAEMFPIPPEKNPTTLSHMPDAAAVIPFHATFMTAEMRSQFAATSAPMATTAAIPKTMGPANASPRPTAASFKPANTAPIVAAATASTPSAPATSKTLRTTPGFFCANSVALFKIPVKNCNPPPELPPVNESPIVLFRLEKALLNSLSCCNPSLRVRAKS